MSEHTPQHANHAEHIDSVKTYALVFAGLIFATVATTAVAFVDLGAFSVVAALAIAVCKMLLVALFSMPARPPAPGA